MSQLDLLLETIDSVVGNVKSTVFENYEFPKDSNGNRYIPGKWLTRSMMLISKANPSDLSCSENIEIVSPVVYKFAKISVGDYTSGRESILPPVYLVAKVLYNMHVYRTENVVHIVEDTGRRCGLCPIRGLSHGRFKVRGMLIRNKFDENDNKTLIRTPVPRYPYIV